MHVAGPPAGIYESCIHARSCICVDQNISLEPLPAKPPPLHSHIFANDEWRVIPYYNKEELEATPVVVAAHDDDNEFVLDDGWDFDNADVIILDKANKDNKAEVDIYPVDFLGFDPYKEIVFFSLSSRTISYNLNTSKVVLSAHCFN
jgi:hypothetical protein